jgi:DNA-binding CsgD family transcriptional regulator
MSSDVRLGGKIRRLDGRNGEVARRYYLHGHTQQAIADDLGISQSLVSDILKRARTELDGTTRESVKADITARLGQLRESLAELLEMEGAPVTAGKDGTVVNDPETGAVVRDYGLRVNAARELRALDERLAKLHGADEPAKVKTDVTVHGESERAELLAAEVAAQAGLDERD